MRRWIRGILILASMMFFEGTGYAQVMFPVADSTTADTVVKKKRRLTPLIYYSHPDKVFAALKFRFAPNNPNQDQSIQLRYSINQNSFSILYDGTFYNYIGNWNLNVNAYYDWLVWRYYFGPGNETVKAMPTTYYRLSTGEYAVNVGINRVINDHHYVDITAYAQGIEVFNKPGTLASDVYMPNPSYYGEHTIFASLRGGYAYQNVDDHILPTRGVMLYGDAGFTLNTQNNGKSFGRYDGIAQFYVPLIGKFSLSVRGGASAISGTPEFYQYVTVGGPTTVRGYNRDRFWGNVEYYNSNELRFITNLRVKKYHNKVGIFALFDDGRVWVPGENSNTIHYGYGGGLLVSPAHKFTAYASYSESPEGGLVQFKVTKLLTRIPASRERR